MAEELERARLKDENLTDYIGHCLMRVKMFARQTGCTMFMVAHPTKAANGRDPTLSDIEGSMHWFNKCDHGVVITRVPDTQVTEVYVAKVRFQETGEQGTVKLRFDRLSGRFELLNDAGAAQMVA